MLDRSPLLSLLAVAAVAAACIACGGGGGGGGSSTSSGGGGSTSNQPPTQTVTDVSNNVVSYGQSVPSTAFGAYGPKLSTKGTIFAVPALGLYAITHLGPEGLTQYFYTDNTGATKAGSLLYVQNDAAASEGGPIAINYGKYAGLTGNYTQKVSYGDSGVIGYDGSVNYTVPKVSNVNNIFQIAIGTGTDTSGTATASINLQNGYSQTESLTYNLDGTMVSKSTDSSEITTSFSFAADLSGTGTISGSDKDLPATVTWNSSGTGTVKYSNGVVVPMTNWSL